MKISTAIKNDRKGNQIIQNALAAGTPIKNGANAPAVKWLERMLKLDGFDVGKVNAVFDAKTKAALRQFQSATGLPQSGRLDQATFAKLQQTQGRIRGQQRRAKSLRVDTFGVGQAGGQVKRSEKLLRKLGYKKVSADGVYDGATARAVRAFEKKNKLKVDGILAPRDYKKMKKVLEARSDKVRPGRGWGGSEGMADVAKKVARQMGIPVTSTKRSAAGSIGSSTGSDHHVSQRNAYAVDFGVAGSKGTKLAHKLAKAYGLKPPYVGTYKNHYIKAEGKTYRVQLLWKVSGHYDHVHMGFRRVS